MPELYPEDQAKVDAFLKTNVNTVERRPFKPLKLLLVIIISLVVMTLIAFFVAPNHGVVWAPPSSLYRRIKLKTQI